MKSDNYMGSNTIQSHGPMYKTDIKNGGNRFRETTFAIAKLQKLISLKGATEKSTIQLKKYLIN